MRVNLGSPIPLLIAAFQTSIHCHQLSINLLISGKEQKTLCNLCKPKGKTALVNSDFSGTGNQVEKLFSISNPLQQLVSIKMGFPSRLLKWTNIIKRENMHFSYYSGQCSV